MSENLVNRSSKSLKRMRIRNLAGGFAFMRRHDFVTEMLRAQPMTSTEFDETGEWPYEPELL